MKSGPITQRRCRMEMTDDFDPAGILPRAITMAKFEPFGLEGFDEVNRAAQFAIVIASDGDRFAKGARFR